MGWRTVVVNTHSKLSYKNNHLIFKDASRTELIHLSEVDILLLETTDIVLSTMLIKRLVDENILVIFCDDKRLPMAYLMPYYGRHDSSLQLSRQIAWNEDVKAEIWTTIIAKFSIKLFIWGVVVFWKRASPSSISIMGWIYLILAIVKGTQLGFILTPCLEMILVVSKIVMSMLPWTMGTP